MDRKLIEATMEAMGYTDMTDICSNCSHFTKDYDEYAGYINYCTYSNLCSFPVEETGNCTKFKQKEND